MPIELFLFSTNEDFIRRAVAAGVHGVIVDWENVGKERRQANADTQINHDTLADLVRVRACTSARVICRINSGDTVAREIEAAIAGGADEILLPMVRTAEDVDRALERAAGRCGIGILVETVAALSVAQDLARLPISRAYVGLNDLRLERHTPSIFTPIIDDTLPRVRDCFAVPFGFGGVTLPDRGAPLPCRLLMSEMITLSCSFTFLRRSFMADVRDPADDVPAIQREFATLATRGPEAVARDRDALRAAVAQLDATASLQAV